MRPTGRKWKYDCKVVNEGATFVNDKAGYEGLGIKDHILQGLYGNIIIESSPSRNIDRYIPIIMAEIGHDVERMEKGPVPYFIMNGMGMPGGEKALEEIFAEQGFDGVAAPFNYTLPVYKAKVWLTVEFSVKNLGDQIHSFHLHGNTMISSTDDRGSTITSQTFPLVQGTLESFIVKPDKPAVWLFHCHVVSHADAGMIGLFIVEE